MVFDDAGSGQRQAVCVNQSQVDGRIYLGVTMNCDAWGDRGRCGVQVTPETAREVARGLTAWAAALDGGRINA